MIQMDKGMQMEKGKVVASSSNMMVDPRTWAPPQKSYSKLNTDGSWISINNVGGGGVIRCDKEKWEIGFSLKFKTIGPASAELLAIKEGMLIAWGRKITNLELETNAQTLKKMLGEPQDYHDHQLSAIIVDVVALLKRDWNVIILYVKREVNRVAHGLAAIGRTMDG